MSIFVISYYSTGTRDGDQSRNYEPSTVAVASSMKEAKKLIDEYKKAYKCDEELVIRKYPLNKIDYDIICQSCMCFEKHICNNSCTFDNCIHTL